MSVEDFAEKKVSGETVFEGRVLTFCHDTVRLPNGGTSTREYVRHKGAVCIVPLTDEGEVLCVRQFRYPIDRIVLEIPAGKLDSLDEDPLEAALRELREETGAVCGKIESLGALYTSPAISDEVIHMYLARELTFGESHPDEDEFLDVIRVPLGELVERILNGEIQDAKTQAAVLKAALLCSAENK